MPNSAAQLTDEPIAEAARKLQHAQRHASAVLDLLERHAVPPVPPFYELFHDYLAGVRAVASARVSNILNQAEQSGTEARALLYEEFVRPFEDRETQERAATLVSARMGVLNELISNSTATVRLHSKALMAAGAILGAEQIQKSLLKEWVARLQTTHQRMLRANTILAEGIATARRELTTTQSEMARLNRESLVDAVTGLTNRNGFEAGLTAAMQAAEQHGGGFCLAMIDIDHFKRLNDNYGHPAGDAVLRLVGKALLTSLRQEEVVCRYGGDEFAALFIGAEQSTTEQGAERLREAVQAADLSKCVGGDILGGATISIGLASFQPGDSIATLFARADKALYEAKAAGRNRWVFG